MILDSSVVMVERLAVIWILSSAGNPSVMVTVAVVFSAGEAPSFR